MRMLFNHGITARELYLGISGDFIKKPSEWWIKNFKETPKVEVFSKIFKHCVALIIQRMIDDKACFKLPYTDHNYWDFKIEEGDDFVIGRQRGRFKEVDFIESDFTAYSIVHKIHSSKQDIIVPVYLGGILKEKLINTTNSGCKIYSAKTAIIDDFISDVHQKFNMFTERELRRLLMFAFKRFSSGMRRRCAFSFISRKPEFIVHIGFIYRKTDKQLREYARRRDAKLRIIKGWVKDWNLKYYIACSDEELTEWTMLNKKRYRIYMFKDVIIRNILEELFYRGPNHIFEIELPKFIGWSVFADEVVAKNVKYLGKVDRYTMRLVPSYKTINEIKKEYAKIEYEYF
jgi:hypothetical protein